MAGDAGDLRKIWSGFQASRVLITANNLKVFDHLKRPQGAEPLARALGTDVRATTILLDALVSIGLAEKHDGRYRNSAMGGRYLVKDAPEYQGDIIRHAETLWQNWSALDEVMATGRPAGRAFDCEAFIMGMHNLAVLKSSEVLKAVRLKGVHKALDLGSGPGTYALEMAERGISTTVFDRPEAVKIAKRLAARRKVKSLRFVEGDFMSDPIGMGFDLILVSQILHAYSAEDNLFLLKKCRDAVNPGGRLVIHEFYIRGDLTYPPRSALFAVNMLVSTAGGRAYSPEEIGGWLKEAGFGKIKRKQLNDTVIIEAARPAR